MNMIAIDANALSAMQDQLNRLEKKLDSVHLTPPPRWIAITEYAVKVGKSEATVRRWIRQGKVEKNGPLVSNPDA